MSERSRDLVLRSLQLFDEPGLVEELVHPSWINHEAMPENRYGRDGARGSVRTMNDALADLRFEPHHVVADGDLVALHVTVTGRHVGSFAGVPATGRRFRTRHVHLYRVEDGMLAEHWAVRDDLTMLSQLGGERAVAAARAS